MTNLLQRIGRWLKRGMLLGALLPVCGGCIYSGAYHVQMFQGHVTPRPFPMIRFWAECSSEQFNFERLYYGIISPIPIGYFGDLAIDTLFFPIDLTMSYWAKQPEMKVLPLEDGNPNGPYRLELYAATSAMHYPDTPDGKEGPVLIDVKQGSLSFYQNPGTLNEKRLIEITPEKQRELIEQAIPQNATPAVRPDNNAKLELYLEASPMRWAPYGLLTSIIIPLVCDMEESFICTFGMLLTHTDRSSGRPRAEGWTPFNRIYRHSADGSAMQRVTLVPSPDFVGSCTYEGKTISEIRFFRQSDWPSSEE